MGRSPWVVSKLGSTQQLRTEVFPKTTLKCVCVCVYVCVCVCMCVCVSPLAVLESVSESSCISASVSPDSQPPAFVWPRPLPGALVLAEELAQASCLPWRGCVRVSVCLSVCLPVARLLSQEGRGLGVGAKGGPR